MRTVRTFSIFTLFLLLVSLFPNPSYTYTPGTQPENDSYWGGPGIDSCQYDHTTINDNSVVERDCECDCFLDDASATDAKGLHWQEITNMWRQMRESAAIAIGAVGDEATIDLKVLPE